MSSVMGQTGWSHEDFQDKHVFGFGTARHSESGMRSSEELRRGKILVRT